MDFLISEEHKNKAGIYCIVCYPTGDLYIGSTSDLEGRYKSHVLCANNSDKGMYKKMRSIGARHFSFELFELCDDKEARLCMERALIAGLRPSLNLNGWRRMRPESERKYRFVVDENELEIIRQIAAAKKATWFSKLCQISTYEFNQIKSSGAGSDTCIQKVRKAIKSNKDLKNVLRRLGNTIAIQ